MPVSLRLYNTLTRTKEPFAPIDPANVRMYVCGPTVYDYAHIGNARPVIVFDVLYRLLTHLAKQGVWDGGKGQTQVTYARNLTDVDDKINARAARDFPELPLNEAIGRVTESTTAQFHKDIAALGNLPPTAEPRATGHIDEMKAIIERLIARGVAYVAEEHVLFHVPAVAHLKNAPGYGTLARRPLDEMIAGARVDVAPYKRDPMDFVLWKPSRPGVDPGWPSPAGIAAPGRPGWHIECSAMSMATLLAPFGGGLACDDPEKNLFDIHGGGIDLVFPHHENEIAQSCCAFGGADGSARMANYWMHNGFLQVEGEKMSKSLGNFVTINELLETETFGGRKWPGEVLRLAMLKTHYRQPIDWTVKALEEAEAELKVWLDELDMSKLNRMREFESPYKLVSWDDAEIATPVAEALYDDLNTPAAIHEVRQIAQAAKSGDDASRVQLLETLAAFGLVRRDNISAVRRVMTIAHGTPWNSKMKRDLERYQSAVSARDYLTALEIFKQYRAGGVTIEHSDDGAVSVSGEEGGASLIDSLITARLAARLAKNFAESDRIRDELAAMGIQLKDGKDAATGEPTTAWEVKR